MTAPAEATPTTPDQATAEPVAPDTDATPDPDADIKKWKALARQHEAEAKKNRTAAERLLQIEEASKSDLEKAVTAAKRETEEAIRGEVRRERVMDRIEVLAAKDFADPEDARLRLGSRADEFVTKDGQVDAAEITKALAALLTDKPHLKAVQPDGRPHGQADLGPRQPAPPANSKAADLAQIEADLRAATRR